MTPEQNARQQIDAQLTASGWFVQDYKAADFSAGRGIALREVPLTTGPCDYLLLVDRKAIGVIEAKKQGTTLSTVAEQSGRYANSLPPLLAAGLTGKLPFLAHREHFRKAYLEPLVTAGWLERTIPDKPTSPNQKYRLTEKGRAWLIARKPEGGK